MPHELTHTTEEEDPGASDPKGGHVRKQIYYYILGVSFEHHGGGVRVWHSDAEIMPPS